LTLRCNFNDRSSISMLSAEVFRGLATTAAIVTIAVDFGMAGMTAYSFAGK
jgi:hypothetical protein